jgi:acetyl esterase/lipase
LEIEDGYCAEMCKRCSLVVVSIDYRLAPQHKFPAALDDCVAGYEWAVQNATSLGASTEKVLLAGGSAGGNLAIGTALRLIDKGSNIQPTALLALVPVTIDPTAVPSHLLSRYTSYEENHDTGPNTPTGMRGFIGERITFALGEAPDTGTDIGDDRCLRPRPSRPVLLRVVARQAWSVAQSLCCHMWQRYFT